jgi:hypothetical protein
MALIKNRLEWILWDRERNLLDGLQLKDVPQNQQAAAMQILSDDPMWSAAKQSKDVSASKEREGHFQSAEGGGNLLPSTTAGAPGPGYTGVGMNLELAAQRRLEEDEEKMYGRAGLFGMTPYGWA